PTPKSTLFPYTTLFRSTQRRTGNLIVRFACCLRGDHYQYQKRKLGNTAHQLYQQYVYQDAAQTKRNAGRKPGKKTETTADLRQRSEEHTSELQSRENLV